MRYLTTTSSSDLCAFVALMLGMSTSCNAYSPDLAGATMAGGANLAGGGAGQVQAGAPNGGADGGTEALGGGGRGDGGDSPTMAGAAGTPEDGRLVIDDMEDGNDFIHMVDGRNGRWSAGNDGTLNGVQFPAPNSWEMTALERMNERPGSRYAVYTSAQGFAEWGAFIHADLKLWPDGPNLPDYDASAYAGVSFYARVSEQSNRAMTFKVLGADTDPRGGRCLEGGPPDTACYDHFKSDVFLTTEWKKYSIRFEQLHQGGFGLQVDALDLRRVYTLEFAFSPTQPDDKFDVWIDDLEFIAR